ncbi:MAG: thioredoxin family protein [Actinomycetota bacterium]|nr:thioredoxin family protein [Actinomycetota bacterium]
MTDGTAAGGGVRPRPVPATPPGLTVYVSVACPGCARARELVALLRRDRPSAAVAVVDLDQLPRRDALPAGVVATPTYVLDGRVRWLGNPSLAELVAAWDAASRPVVLAPAAPRQPHQK